MTLINTSSIKSQRKIYGIIAAIITYCFVGFNVFLNHDNHLETDQSLCPFQDDYWFHCPGCGITKSLVYFYEGDLLKVYIIIF
jgi:hypothetical protein